MSSIILGIDPGSRITGYGVIHLINNKISYVDSGCIKTEVKNFPARLLEIYNSVSIIMNKYNPNEMAIEEVFVKNNVSAALKLGQARGAAIVAVAKFKTPISEYSARYVKRALVGYGGADKKQVQSMVVKILNLGKKPQADAADALAIAICHSNTINSLLKR